MSEFNLNAFQLVAFASFLNKPISVDKEKKDIPTFAVKGIIKNENKRKICFLVSFLLDILLDSSPYFFMAHISLLVFIDT